MMLIKKNSYAAFLLLYIGLAGYTHSLYGVTCAQTIIYYLNIADFVSSFIAIPTSNVLQDSSTIASQYLAGRASLYDVNDIKVGTCSGTFLSIQNADGIFTDITNSLSATSGLIVTWFTPTTLINLELDTIVNAMVTQCTVVETAATSPFFGQTYSLTVTSDGVKIYFQFDAVRYFCVNGLT